MGALMLACRRSPSCYSLRGGRDGKEEEREPHPFVLTLMCHWHSFLSTWHHHLQIQSHEAQRSSLGLHPAHGCMTHIRHLGNHHQTEASNVSMTPGGIHTSPDHTLTSKVNNSFDFYLLQFHLFSLFFFVNWSVGWIIFCVWFTPLSKFLCEVNPYFCVWLVCSFKFFYSVSFQECVTISFPSYHRWVFCLCLVWGIYLGGILKSK